MNNPILEHIGNFLIPNMKYLRTFIKGINPNLPEDYRFEFELLDDISKDGITIYNKGDKIIAYYLKDQPMHQFIGSTLDILQVKHLIKKSNTHYKFKNYNYYYLDTDYTKVHDLLKYMFKNKKLKRYRYEGITY